MKQKWGSNLQAGWKIQFSPQSREERKESLDSLCVLRVIAVQAFYF
jgi:hypothetical protein